MNRLSIVSTLVGAFILATRLPGVLMPSRFRDFAVKFPRSVLWGRVLMGIAAAIAWVIVYNAATDEWSWARPLIVVGFPVAYWLVIKFGTHFLALRGTAALMLLAAKQMVDAADASDLSSRLFVTTFAYLWVIAAIWLTVAPHHFRNLIGYVTANNTRCRVACACGVVLGLVLIALGLFVY